MATSGLGQESIPARESAAIKAVAELLKDTIERNFHRARASGSESVVALRDAHPKHHALVVGRFVVEPSDGISETPHYGVFGQPAREYRALIRFSSSRPDVGPDTRSDLRGMAIKLLDVGRRKALAGDESTNQDFLLASSRQFFVRNAFDYLDFTLAFHGGTAQLARYFLRSPSRLRDLRALAWPMVRHAGPFRPASLFDLEYFSQTAYLSGNRAVKYKVEASDVTKAVVRSRGRSRPSENYLRDAMMRYLASDDATFDFSLQIQSDPAEMPVEDPMIVWNEKVSPFRKVATLVIPRQDFHTDLHWKWAEHISFSPWRCLDVHRPLGGINRTRRVVYEQISALRHHLNNVRQAEPSVEDWEALASESGIRFDQLQPV